MEKTQVLVTGAAGFIGFHVAHRLVQDGHIVCGLDNVNDYYDVGLKRSRLEVLKRYSNFRFYEIDLADQPAVNRCFEENKFLYVVNLAAQAGVRYSLVNPHAYLQSNVTGFLNILEACRHHQIRHLVYASSSSVYGANKKLPFSVHDNVDHPLSLYAATKKSNELMAHTYSSFFGLPTTGLRFFSVYGPYGRPDMALFIFTRNIIEGKPIDVYNNGMMMRDFTFVDDIVESIVRLIPSVASPNPDWNGASPDPATSFAPYRVYNIGNNSPVMLNEFIEAIEERLGRKAIRNMMPMQPGDVPESHADVEALIKEIDFKPSTSIREGINKFLDWYLKYFDIKL